MSIIMCITHVYPNTTTCTCISAQVHAMYLHTLIYMYHYHIHTSSQQYIIEFLGDVQQQPGFLEHYQLTGIEVVFVSNPENGGQDLKDVEWMEHLLYEENMVGLHWDINGVSTMVDQSGGRGEDREREREREPTA